VESDRWLRFTRRDPVFTDAPIGLVRRGEPMTGHAAVDCWRDPGTTYGLTVAQTAELLHDLLTTLPADVVEAELRRCGHAPKSAVLAMIDAVEMLEDLDVALAGLTGEPREEHEQDDQE
jgi:hypothetical protein